MLPLDDTPPYILVSTKGGLALALRSLEQTAALDFETTSLSPDDGRVRLVSLYDGRAGYLVDFDRIKGGFAAVAHLFRTHHWVVFHAGFEYSWFAAAGVPDIRLHDVGNLRRAILGGGSFRLRDLVQWDLDTKMSKEEQKSDWSAPKLRQEQLDYAFRDAYLTWELREHWRQKADDGQLRGAAMFDGMIPAVHEMQASGILVDKVAHDKLVRSWIRVQWKHLSAVSKAVPEVDNIKSDRQWSDYFSYNFPDHLLAVWPRTSATGQLSMTAEVLRHFGGRMVGTPLSDFLLSLANYKSISKYISSFGDTLIAAAEQSADGRVRARFNIGYARTGRFSSSKPNLQQVPRDRSLLGVATSVRRSFIAREGYSLVSLDYSGIELRVLALLSGDEVLLADMVGGDVHSEVAAAVAGAPIDRSTPEGKAARQAAKAVSFGIVYGSAATGLSGTMKTTTKRAQSFIDFWANRYSRAYRYRYIVQKQVSESKGFLRCVDGGTIYMGRLPDLPKLSNYPVQRAALSVMAAAISRHKTDLDEARKNGKQTRTRMLSTIHDALIDEAPKADARRCLQMMQSAMTKGYLDVFPGAPIDRLVEGGIGSDWSGIG